MGGGYKNILQEFDFLAICRVANFDLGLFSAIFVIFKPNFHIKGKAGVSGLDFRVIQQSGVAIFVTLDPRPIPLKLYYWNVLFVQNGTKVSFYFTESVRCSIFIVKSLEVSLW